MVRLMQLWQPMIGMARHNIHHFPIFAVLLHTCRKECPVCFCSSTPQRDSQLMSLDCVWSEDSLIWIHRELLEARIKSSEWTWNTMNGFKIVLLCGIAYTATFVKGFLYAWCNLKDDLITANEMFWSAFIVHKHHQSYWVLVGCLKSVYRMSAKCPKGEHSTGMPTLGRRSTLEQHWVRLVA